MRRSEQSGTESSSLSAPEGARKGARALYSPECVEGELSEVELPLYAVLRSSAFSRALLHWALTLRRRAWVEEEQAYAIR